MLISSETRSCAFSGESIPRQRPVHAPSAPRSVSFGLGPFLCSLAASNSTVCPEGIVARNSSSPDHFTTAVRISIVSLLRTNTHSETLPGRIFASSVAAKQAYFYASAESLGRSEAPTPASTVCRGARRIVSMNTRTSEGSNWFAAQRSSSRNASSGVRAFLVGALGSDRVVGVGDCDHARAIRNAFRLPCDPDSRCRRRTRDGGAPSAGCVSWLRAAREFWRPAQYASSSSPTRWHRAGQTCSKSARGFLLCRCHAAGQQGVSLPLPTRSMPSACAIITAYAETFCEWPCV